MTTFNNTLSGSITNNGSLIRLTKYTIAASDTFIGSLFKQPRRSLAGTISLVGATPTRLIIHILNGNINILGSLFFTLRHWFKVDAMLVRIKILNWLMDALLGGRTFKVDADLINRPNSSWHVDSDLISMLNFKAAALSLIEQENVTLGIETRGSSIIEQRGVNLNIIVLSAG